jgi:hypothetical protein
VRTSPLNKQHEVQEGLPNTQAALIFKHLGRFLTLYKPSSLAGPPFGCSVFTEQPEGLVKAASSTLNNSSFTNLLRLCWHFNQDLVQPAD